MLRLIVLNITFTFIAAITSTNLIAQDTYQLNQTNFIENYVKYWRRHFFWLPSSIEEPRICNSRGEVITGIIKNCSMDSLNSSLCKEYGLIEVSNGLLDGKYISFKQSNQNRAYLCYFSVYNRGKPVSVLNFNEFGDTTLSLVFDYTQQKCFAKEWYNRSTLKFDAFFPISEFDKLINNSEMLWVGSRFYANGKVKDRIALNQDTARYEFNSENGLIHTRIFATSAKWLFTEINNENYIDNNDFQTIEISGDGVSIDLQSMILKGYPFREGLISGMNDIATFKGITNNGNITTGRLLYQDKQFREEGVFITTDKSGKEIARHVYANGRNLD